MCIRALLEALSVHVTVIGISPVSFIYIQHIVKDGGYAVELYLVGILFGCEVQGILDMRLRSIFLFWGKIYINLIDLSFTLSVTQFGTPGTVFLMKKSVC